MVSNKIFIHKKDLSYSGVKKSDSDITFIRKDALMAFLNERRKGFVAGERKILREIIEKIESL